MGVAVGLIIAGLLSGATDVSLSVLVHGDATVGARLRQHLEAEGRLPMNVLLRELPNAVAAPAPRGEVAERLAEARRRYIDADFPGCLERVAGDALINDLLAEGRRALAARLLFWRVACHVARGASTVAATDARHFAVLGLDVPPDVEAATPEVERALGGALVAVREGPQATLHVTSARRGASVWIDGRGSACVTPCAVDLAVGAHVVAVGGEGLSPVARPVRVAAGGSTASFEPLLAPPELAATQWTERYAATALIDSTPSVRLLSLAVRTRRLALLVVERQTRAVRLRGVLVVDGEVAARAERVGAAGRDVADEAAGVIRDLLVDAKILEPSPALVERPLFWVAVAGVAGLAAGVTAALLTRPTRTRVVFGEASD